MRVTNRVKISGILSMFVLATILGAFLVSGLLTRGQAIQAAGVSSYAGTKGFLAPAAVVDPRALASDATPASTFPKAARRLHTVHGTIRAGASAGITPVPVSTSTPGLLENFNGVS